MQARRMRHAARFKREDSNGLFQTFTSKNAAESTGDAGRLCCFSVDRSSVAADERCRLASYFSIESGPGL